ncbi:MAG TPA: hypothetical protein VNK03_00070 [Gammaproteobacteria bacterium]|nr:hypothetical protein [Gammaproteobacteria bacterium]
MPTDNLTTPSLTPLQGNISRIKKAFSFPKTSQGLTYKTLLAQEKKLTELQQKINPFLAQQAQNKQTDSQARVKIAEERALLDKKVQTLKQAKEPLTEALQAAIQRLDQEEADATSRLLEKHKSAQAQIDKEIVKTDIYTNLQKTEKLMKKTHPKAKYHAIDQMPRLLLQNRLHLIVKQNVVSSLKNLEPNTGVLDSATAYSVAQLEKEDPLLQEELRKRCIKSGWKDNNGNLEYTTSTGKLITMSNVVSLTHDAYVTQALQLDKNSGRNNIQGADKKALETAISQKNEATAIMPAHVEKEKPVPPLPDTPVPPPPETPEEKRGKFLKESQQTNIEPTRLATQIRRTELLNNAPTKAPPPKPPMLGEFNLTKSHTLSLKEGAHQPAKPTPPREPEPDHKPKPK